MNFYSMFTVLVFFASSVIPVYLLRDRHYRRQRGQSYLHLSEVRQRIYHWLMTISSIGYMSVFLVGMFGFLSNILKGFPVVMSSLSLCFASFMTWLVIHKWIEKRNGGDWVNRISFFDLGLLIISAMGLVLALMFTFVMFSTR